MEPNKSKQVKKILDLFAKTFLFLIVSIICATMVSAQGTVEIKGQLSASGADLNDALVTVELDGEQCIAIRVNPNGAFRFELPTGSTAVLTVKKPGFTSKTVTIDTENALSSKRAKKKNKSIAFEVELLPRSFDDDYIYSGPVGSISFIRGSGLMKVRYDHTMQDPEQARALNVFVYP